MKPAWQAAMETLEWPEGVSKPEFMTREYGKTTGERASRVRTFWHEI